MAAHSALTTVRLLQVRPPQPLQQQHQRRVHQHRQVAQLPAAAGSA